MKNRISLKASLKNFQKELKGYVVRLQLSREDTKNSKIFEDLDFEIVFNHLTRVLPGIKLSVHGGYVEYFEDPEEDKLNKLK